MARPLPSLVGVIGWTLATAFTPELAPSSVRSRASTRLHMKTPGMRDGGPGWLARIPGSGNVANRRNFIQDDEPPTRDVASPPEDGAIQDDGKDAASMWLPTRGKSLRNEEDKAGGGGGPSVGEMKNSMASQTGTDKAPTASASAATATTADSAAAAADTPGPAPKPVAPPLPVSARTLGAERNTGLIRPSRGPPQKTGKYVRPTVGIVPQSAPRVAKYGGREQLDEAMDLLRVKTPPQAVSKIYDEYKQRAVNDYRENLKQRGVALPIEDRLVELLLVGAGNSASKNGVSGGTRGLTKELRRTVRMLCEELIRVGAQVPDATLPSGVAGDLVGDWEVLHVQAEKDLLSTSPGSDVPLRSRFSAAVQRACRVAALRRFRDEGAGYDDVEEGDGEARGTAAVADGADDDGARSPSLAVLASDDLKLPLVPFLRVRLWRIGNRQHIQEGWSECVWTNKILQFGPLRIGLPIFSRGEWYTRAMYVGDSIRLEKVKRSLVVLYRAGGKARGE